MPEADVGESFSSLAEIVRRTSDALAGARAVVAASGRGSSESAGGTRVAESELKKMSICSDIYVFYLLIWALFWYNERSFGLE